MTVFEKFKKEFEKIKPKEYANVIFGNGNIRCQSCKYLNTKKCSGKIKIGSIENCIEGIELFLNSEVLE